MLLDEKNEWEEYLNDDVFTCFAFNKLLEIGEINTIEYSGNIETQRGKVETYFKSHESVEPDIIWLWEYAQSVDLTKEGNIYFDERTCGYLMSFLAYWNKNKISPLNKNAFIYDEYGCDNIVIKFKAGQLLEQLKDPLPIRRSSKANLAKPFYLRKYSELMNQFNSNKNKLKWISDNPEYVDWALDYIHKTQHLTQPQKAFLAALNKSVPMMNFTSEKRVLFLLRFLDCLHFVDSQASFELFVSKMKAAFASMKHKKKINSGGSLKARSYYFRPETIKKLDHLCQQLDLKPATLIERLIKEASVKALSSKE